MLQSPILLVALFAASGSGHAVACPAGTTPGHATLPGGFLEQFCASAAGVRNGEYAEWSPEGRQVVWGSFESGLEHGVWTMDVEHGGDRTIVFVVFDHGKNLTQSILDRLVPSCADWNAKSGVARAGTVATLALFSSSKLPGALAELNKNRAAVAVCLARRASLSESIGAAQCTTDKAFEDNLQHTVLSVASECLLSQRSAAAE